MAISMVKARTISMVLGGALLVFSGILMLLNDTLDGILWLEVLLGLGLFGGGLFQHLGLEKPLKDERAARIGTRAATYSWYAMFILVCFMAMVFGFGGGWKISMSQAVGAMLIVMVVSILGLNWYLGRRGDVE
mgnify:FL=1|jgi:hypothetical protein